MGVWCMELTHMHTNYFSFSSLNLIPAAYYFQMNMSSVLGAKVLTRYFQRKTASSFSDVRR